MECYKAPKGLIEFWYSLHFSDVTRN